MVSGVGRGMDVLDGGGHMGGAVLIIPAFIELIHKSVNSIRLRVQQLEKERFLDFEKTYKNVKLERHDKAYRPIVYSAITVCARSDNTEYLTRPWRCVASFSAVTSPGHVTGSWVRRRS